MRLALALALMTLLPATAHAAAPSAGRPFEPHPVSEELYESAASPAGNHTLTAADGTSIYVEWWLPIAKAGGPAPPAKLPVVAHLSPYLRGDRPGELDTKDAVLARGYAYATMHVRGTGLSGGCQEQFSSNEVSDAAMAIEWFGRDAPFSDGKVGTTGLSYPGITQVAAAGRGEPEKVKYLKAVIAGGVATSQYDYNFFDGVPYTGQAAAHTGAYFGGVSTASVGPNTAGDRFNCAPEVFLGSADSSGDMTPFWQDREHRVGATRTKTATLIYHGHLDAIDRPIALAGYFERLSRPKHLILGLWPHDFPSSNYRPDFQRDDWLDTKLAWFDRWLKGRTDTQVDFWPTVQVQDTEGQWRAAKDWPFVGGPAGHLALGEGGKLGVTAASGASSFVDSSTADSGAVKFTTEPLPGRLHITGQPVLDLWLTLNADDAHVAAYLEALNGEGRPIADSYALGFRSMNHNEPLVENRFWQFQSKPAPVGQQFRSFVRFDPVDIVVPQGGRLRLTLSGSQDPNGLSPSQPSGKNAIVTIAHDCASQRVSALRFMTVEREPQRMNVREVDESTPLPAENLLAPPPPSSNAAGLVTEPVCGQPTLRLDMFGPRFEGLPSQPPPNPVIRLTHKPKKLFAGRKTKITFRTLPGGLVRFAGRKAKANKSGVATMRVKIRKPGLYKAVATFEGGRVSTWIKVVKKKRRR